VAGVTFKIDLEKGLDRLNAVTPSAKKAVPRAINKTLLTVRKDAADVIKEKGGILAGITRVRNSLKIIRASISGNDIFGTINGRGGAGLPLIFFKVQPKISKRGRHFIKPIGGLSATVFGKVFGDAHAFFARMPSGHVGVFKRKTSSRTPIAEMRGPTMAEMLADDSVIDRAHHTFDTRFPVVLQQEIKFAIRK
jgi:Prophage minor tail protein Z (GPZ)